MCTHPNSHFSFSCVCSMKNPHSSSNWTQIRSILGLQVHICSFSKPVSITIIIFSHHLHIQSLQYEGHSSPFVLSRSTETIAFILLLRNKISLERDCIVTIFAFFLLYFLKTCGLPAHRASLEGHRKNFQISPFFSDLAFFFFFLN